MIEIWIGTSEAVVAGLETSALLAHREAEQRQPHEVTDELQALVVRESTHDDGGDVSAAPGER